MLKLKYLVGIAGPTLRACMSQLSGAGANSFKQRPKFNKIPKMNS